VAYTKVAVTPASTEATITWKTYEPATTQVKYGVTSGYGLVSPLNPAMATTHAVVLTGLLPRTAYHYQVISVDAAGSVAALQDQTFTTAP
jgi:phosphodiesterase/alkaline phosphatase D-like protein